MSKFGVIGSYFFEDDRGMAVTVNAQRYVAMLQEFFFTCMHEDESDIQNVWFQQDAATAHIATVSMTVIREAFPGRLLSRNGDIPWPPRSPDLSRSDFFLWGYLKSKVYQGRPRTIPELKEAIQSEIAAIPGAMLENVMKSFSDHLQECIQFEDRHLSDIIFHT